MAHFNTLQQSFNQMDDKKQVICIWNPNHILNHSRYQKHQLHCPDRPKNVYKCQYNFLHEFRSLSEKDQHELNCEGMKRRLREQKEREELKKKVGAPVVVEQLRPGESTDPWADEGSRSWCQRFPCTRTWFDSRPDRRVHSKVQWRGSSLRVHAGCNVLEPEATNQ